MILDTHCHYDDSQFDQDRETLLKSLPENKVCAVVNMGASWQGCLDSLALAKAYPHVYAGLGIHPDEVGFLNEETLNDLKNLILSNDKVVCVGEIGLDYHWMVEAKEVQQAWMIRQLQLAEEVGLPVNIHSREASEDTFRIMKEYGPSKRGIIHCYSGSAELAKEYVKLGYCIGVGGVVTFKNGKRLKEAVAAIPLSSIVLETDCPYMAPEPFRGSRNDSTRISHVADEIAKIKGISPDQVLEETEQNARRVYRI